MAGCGSGTSPTSSRASGIRADGRAIGTHGRARGAAPPRGGTDRRDARSRCRRATSLPAKRCAKLLDPGTHGLRQPSAERDASRHRRRLRQAASRRLRSRCRMSPRVGWRASPRPAISCSAPRPRRVSSGVLIIGGDDSPVGPFRASLDLLATGVVERHGISHVAFAGYPEGHPTIDRRALDAALQAKVALARQRGLDVSLVTQFGFEAAPILRWIASLRAQDIDLSGAGRHRRARDASRHSRSSRCAAASAHRCARWPAATPPSRASWRRPAPTR